MDPFEEASVDQLKRVIRLLDLNIVSIRFLENWINDNFTVPYIDRISTEQTIKFWESRATLRGLT